MTRYHLGGSIELSGYIRERDRKFWASVGGLPAQPVCSFQFQLWLGVSKLIARTCHLCVVFHCQVVISTNSSIPELLLCYG